MPPGRAFDSYGNLISETNAAVDHLFGFTGRPFDETTGLQNNTNRWYDAAVGRWISNDPIAFDGLDTSLYRYCGNNPVNCTDPTGTWRWFGWFRAPSWEELVDQEMALVKELNARFGTSHTRLDGFTAAERDMIENALGQKFDWEGGAIRAAYGALQQRDATLGASEAWLKVAAVADALAAGALAWVAAGLPTFGAGVVSTSESSVIFEVSGQLYMGTSSGVVAIPAGTAWAQMGYWTSITGLPILSGEAAVAGAGGALWLANHPCASRALQAFVNGWIPW